MKSESLSTPERDLTVVSTRCWNLQAFHAGHWNVKPRFRKASAGCLGCFLSSIGGNLHGQKVQVIPHPQETLQWETQSDETRYLFTEHQMNRIR